MVNERNTHRSHSERCRSVCSSTRKSTGMSVDPLSTPSAAAPCTCSRDRICDRLCPNGATTAPHNITASKRTPDRLICVRSENIYPGYCEGGCRICIPDYGKSLTHDTLRKVAIPYRKFSFKDALIKSAHTRRNRLPPFHWRSRGAYDAEDACEMRLYDPQRRYPQDDPPHAG